MPRYIDAEGLNLYDNLFMSEDTINKSGVYVRYRAVENLIKNAPTADVQEVKHGKWIKNKEHGYYECSNCKSTKPYDGICEENPDKVTYWVCDYCPKCGAKMDEKECV